MKLMVGIDLANEMLEEIKNETKTYIIRPSVAVIQIGHDPISDMDIKLKEEACNKSGIYFRYYEFEDGTPELTVINKIKELNNDDYVNGIVIELPLPDKYNERRLLNTIINSKDIYGVTDINVGRLISGRKTIVPPTPQAILELLKINEVDLIDKNVVLIGKGKLVGRPLINLLLKEGANLTICHSQTKNIKKFTKSADIIICASSVKDILTGDMVNAGVVVIDAGWTVEGKKMCGNVEFKTVSKKASLITSFEDGVEPLSVAYFLKNVLMCYNNKK